MLLVSTPNTNTSISFKKPQIIVTDRQPDVPPKPNAQQRIRRKPRSENFIFFATRVANFYNCVQLKILYTQKTKKEKENEHQETRERRRKAKYLEGRERGGEERRGFRLQPSEDYPGMETRVYVEAQREENKERERKRETASKAFQPFRVSPFSLNPLCLIGRPFKARSSYNFLRVSIFFLGSVHLCQWTSSPLPRPNYQIRPTYSTEQTKEFR